MISSSVSHQSWVIKYYNTLFVILLCTIFVLLYYSTLMRLTTYWLNIFWDLGIALLTLSSKNLSFGTFLDFSNIFLWLFIWTFFNLQNYFYPNVKLNWHLLPVDLHLALKVVLKITYSKHKPFPPFYPKNYIFPHQMWIFLPFSRIMLEFHYTRTLFSCNSAKTFYVWLFILSLKQIKGIFGWINNYSCFIFDCCNICKMTFIKI